ncbi:hypothetical protein ACFO5R_07445 [Halosolutus amylolyticus]|uniref:Right handed beta helix region n=1 Tax=Halosolutus amylolyticus TaxID=2932267 RepID=A0ABD5PMJ6_9EURY|nr:hypothetical protein [Halosolutus amylolyticus]
MEDTDRLSDRLRERSIDRRTYLTGTGAALGSIGAFAGFAGTGTAAEYETITVPSGQVHTIQVGDGDVLENVLIDITAPNSGYQIRAYGTDWTIRNVGVKGEFDNGDDTPFHVRDTDPNGESVIENVYLGDGANDSFQWNTHQVTGIYVHADHAGDLLIKNVHVNEFRDNAFYGSDPGHPYFDYSEYGTVRIEDCFARNGGFNFRISTEGSYCKNCVSVITDSYNTGGPRLFYDYFSRGIEYIDCDAQGYGDHIGWGNGSTSWSQYTENGDVKLEGCSANVGQTVGGEHPGQLSGERPSSNPRDSPEEVEGVPLSAAEAASGTSGSGGRAGISSPDSDDADEDDLDNTVLIDGVGTVGSTTYEFSVTGDVEKSTHSGASIDGEDVIESGRVSGAVAGWRDAFRFSGEVEELTVDGSARVLVNGERVDPSEYGDDLPHVLTIVGNGTESAYEVTVDGTIDTLDEESSDEIELTSDAAATGTIERGVHRLRFSGDLVDVTFTEGGTQVYLDQERIDPDDYDADRELPPHAIVIDGSDTDGATSYSFTIDGDVVKSNYRDASIDDGDEIDGTTVRGVVADYLDAYWFDGDIDEFRLAGNASVDVEYDAREK